MGLALFHPMTWRQAFALGLDEGNGHGLGIGKDLHAQRVVASSFGSRLARPPITSMAPVVSSRRIRPSVDPRACIAGWVSSALVSDSRSTATVPCPATHPPSTFPPRLVDGKSRRLSVHHINLAGGSPARPGGEQDLCKVSFLPSSGGEN